MLRLPLKIVLVAGLLVGAVGCGDKVPSGNNGTGFDAKPLPPPAAPGAGGDAGKAPKGGMPGGGANIQ